MPEYHPLPAEARSLHPPGWRPTPLERLGRHRRSAPRSSIACLLFKQTALDDPDQSLQIDWLANVLIHACLQAALTVMWHGEGGECNDGCVSEIGIAS